MSRRVRVIEGMGGRGCVGGREWVSGRERVS